MYMYYYYIFEIDILPHGQHNQFIGFVNIFSGRQFVFTDGRPKFLNYIYTILQGKLFSRSGYQAGKVSLTCTAGQFARCLAFNEIAVDLVIQHTCKCCFLKLLLLTVYFYLLFLKNFLFIWKGHLTRLYNSIF